MDLESIITLVGFAVDARFDALASRSEALEQRTFDIGARRRPGAG